MPTLSAMVIGRRGKIATGNGPFRIQLKITSPFGGRRKSHDVSWALHRKAQPNQRLGFDCIPIAFCIQPKRPFATAPFEKGEFI